ncbi:MAG: hypothetical protein ACLFVJ_21785 [Persicimonas sp.]
MNNRAIIRWAMALTIALGFTLFDINASWAQCPEGKECATVEKLRACNVCKLKLDGADGEPGLEERAREAEAMVNMERGRADELRLRVKAMSVERDEWRDRARDAERRPQWLTVVGVGVGALVVGWGVGVLGPPHLD